MPWHKHLHPAVPAGKSQRIQHKRNKATQAAAPHPTAGLPAIAGHPVTGGLPVIAGRPAQMAAGAMAATHPAGAHPVAVRPAVVHPAAVVNGARVKRHP